MRPTQLLQAQKQYQQREGLVDPTDNEPFLYGDQPPIDPLNTSNNNISANYNSSSRKFKKKKIKPTTRIAKYGSMLDAEGKI